MKNNHSGNIVFMGSPQFAATILREISIQLRIVGVITQPDKRAGRGKNIKASAVKETAIEKGIPFIQPSRLTTDAVQSTLVKWNPDLIIVAAYGKILGSDILEYPEFGCINVHASLLPRWRGASPVHAAILHGDKTTGVTIMKMDEGIDTGGILSQKEVKVSPTATTASLTEELAHTGAELLTATIPDYLSGKIIPVEQLSQNATYAGIIEKQDGELDFLKGAEELEKQIRAYNPWPISYFLWDNKRVKVYQANILSTKTLAPGQRGITEKFPCMGTGTYDIQLLEIQLPGKNKINGKAFLNGVRNWC